MGKNRKKVMLLSLLSTGVLGTSLYLMNATLIEGSVPVNGTAASSSDTSEPNIKVTATPDTAAATAETEPSAPSEAETATTVASENSAAQEVPQINPASIYTVQSDETLWEIAQSAGVSMQDLMNENQLSSSVIMEGQGLIVEK